MSLVDKIKSDVKKSGSNKGKLLFIREGVKSRVRFLNDMGDGMEVTFHDNFAAGITPVPCQEIFGRHCPYCDEEADVRTRSQYIWSVWDYDAKEVKLFMFPVNNCSPIPALMAMYENYGTLTDRDYVISVSGKKQNKTYAVIPMDKVRFRNEKAKPYSEKAILKILDKAYPCDAASDDEGDEDEEEERTASRKAKKRPPKSTGKKSKPKYEEDEDEEEEEKDSGWEDEDEEEDDVDYSSMSPKELYKLCKERDIDVQPKKPAKYYINQLEEYDKAQDDWGDAEEEDEDDWEDE